MANPQKAKGTRWESAVVTFLRDLGFSEARREVQRGRLDVGDVGGFPSWALECKAYKTVGFSALAEFVTQAKREAENAGKPWGAVVLKRPRGGTADAFVIMDLATWAEVERALPS